MLPHEVKINNVNSSSFGGTQCGISVGEDMLFKERWEKIDNHLDARELV